MTAGWLPGRAIPEYPAFTRGYWALDLRPSAPKNAGDNAGDKLQNRQFTERKHAARFTACI
jgi:hypothetical protein